MIWWKKKKSRQRTVSKVRFLRAKPELGLEWIPPEPEQKASDSQGPLEALHMVLLGTHDTGQPAELPVQYRSFSQGPREVAQRKVEALKSFGHPADDPVQNLTKNTKFKGKMTDFFILDPRGREKKKVL